MRTIIADLLCGVKPDHIKVMLFRKCAIVGQQIFDCPLCMYRVVNRSSRRIIDFRTENTFSGIRTSICRPKIKSNIRSILQSRYTRYIYFAKKCVIGTKTLGHVDPLVSEIFYGFLRIYPVVILRHPDDISERTVLIIRISNRCRTQSRIDPKVISPINRIVIIGTEAHAYTFANFLIQASSQRKTIKVLAWKDGLITKIPRAKVIDGFFRATRNTEVLTGHNSILIQQILPIYIHIIGFVHAVLIKASSFPKFDKLGTIHHRITRKQCFQPGITIKSDSSLLSGIPFMRGNEDNPIGAPRTINSRR